jgi:cytoskeletal protein RodZ
MFHPVGSQPPAVYWRRRLAFLGTLLILVVLVIVTARVLLGGDGAAEPLAGTGSPTQTSSRASSQSSPTSTSASHTSSSASSSTSTTSGASSSTTTPPPQRCDRSKLEVRAVTDATSYHVGDKPKLMLQVTDTAKTPCVQDLADPQIELRVYNGESRVWGSHDCKILAGTSDVTLLPAKPVRVTIVWSGLSSRENSAHTTAACGPRQVVGAGTYTLYPYLAGKGGNASQFSIS